MFVVCLGCRYSFAESAPQCPHCGCANDTGPLLSRMRIYIGQNWERYHEPFVKLLNAERTGTGAGWTWNWAAAFLLPWFLYRRLWGAFFLLLLGHLVLLPFKLGIVLFVLQGYLADRLLFEKARREVANPALANDLGRIAMRGEPALWAVWTFVGAIFGLPVLVMVAMGVVGAASAPADDTGGDVADAFTREVIQSAERSTATAFKEVAGSDGRSRVIVPAGWRTLDELDEDAVIRVGDPPKRVFLVLRFPRADIGPGATLERVAERMGEVRREALTEVSAEPPRAMTVGGHRARQYETRGVDHMIRYVVWDTMVETPTAYYHLVAYTFASDGEAAEPVFREVIDSFREMEPEDAGAPGG
ncbi:MAG TPA: hypothetical protein VFQ39_13505 [Longimicrobium sp.]|nr:hypothetical protein [Longimicrobium sp.]